jgi:hypothetical protein
MAIIDNQRLQEDNKQLLQNQLSTQQQSAYIHEQNMRQIDLDLKNRKRIL